MRKKEISQLVLKISAGIFSSLVDLFLWNIFYITEVSFSGSPGNLRKAGILAEKDLQRFNSDTLKRVAAIAQKRGFIKEDLTLTKEGRERLAGKFPKFFNKRKWDGNWYLVIYDIPEDKKRLRRILRDNLKRLDFGKLQASVWVSPFNFLAEIEKIVKSYQLSSCVIFAISNQLGQEEARVLARKVWRLDAINNLYAQLLEEMKGEKGNKKENLYFQYLNILRQDPQLPKEILPQIWNGEKVHKLFKKFSPD